METNSNFLKLSSEVPLVLEIVTEPPLLHPSTILVLMELGFASQSQEFVSWSCKSPSQPHQGSSNSKSIWSVQEVIKSSCS